MGDNQAALAEVRRRVNARCPGGLSVSPRGRVAHRILGYSINGWVDTVCRQGGGYIGDLSMPSDGTPRCRRCFPKKPQRGGLDG